MALSYCTVSLRSNQHLTQRRSTASIYNNALPLSFSNALLIRLRHTALATMYSPQRVRKQDNVTAAIQSCRSTDYSPYTVRNYCYVQRQLRMGCGNTGSGAHSFERCNADDTVPGQSAPLQFEQISGNAKNLVSPYRL